MEELGAAGLLVGFADAAGLAAEAVEGPEEPEVLGVGGTHVAGTPPAGLAKGSMATSVYSKNATVQWGPKSKK